jgi:iron complex transport system substrate-binding protein
MIVRRFENVPPRRVLIVTEPLSDPPATPWVAGPGSFYDDLLRLGGHVNAAAPIGRPFSTMSLEYILEVNPEVIIELSTDRGTRPNGDEDARRAWARVGPLRAVATGRVHVIAAPQLFILGPRIAVTLEAICGAIAGGGNG